jgi:hypothetical protein
MKKQVLLNKIENFLAKYAISPEEERINKYEGKS